LLLNVLCLQVERALTLWHDNWVNCESVAAFQAGHASSFLIGNVNTATGHVSAKEAEFDEKHWGSITNEYLDSATTRLAQRPEKFDKLITDAKRYVKPGQRRDAGAPLTRSEVRGKRALLMDDSD
jgi:hypothetical protein